METSLAKTSPARNAAQEKARQRWNRCRAAKPEQYNAKSRAYRARNPEQYMWTRAKYRAKCKGVPFEITPEDIVIPDVCPLLGIPLNRSSTGKAQPNSPALDRKVTALGYIKGNIWVISNRANTLKGDATLEELELLVHNLRASSS